MEALAAAAALTGLFRDASGSSSSSYASGSAEVVQRTQWQERGQGTTMQMMAIHVRNNNMLHKKKNQAVAKRTECG
jgi:hypothetical protein